MHEVGFVIAGTGFGIRELVFVAGMTGIVIRMF